MACIDLKFYLVTLKPRKPLKHAYNVVNLSVPDLPELEQPEIFHPKQKQVRRKMNSLLNLKVFSDEVLLADSSVESIFAVSNDIGTEYIRNRSILKKKSS